MTARVGCRGPLRDHGAFGELCFACYVVTFRVFKFDLSTMLRVTLWNQR